MKMLLKGSPDLVFSTDDVGNTPLHWAAHNGHMDVARLLLASRADVNAVGGPVRDTPLHYATLNGHMDVAQLLLANKADVAAKNNYGYTPLHRAAEEGNKNLAELLLASKAEVNAKDNHGLTPLYLALGHGHKDVAELLREHGGQRGRSVSQDVADAEATEDPILRSVRVRRICLEMDTFETGEKNPQRVLCSDDACPCSEGQSLVIGRTAYLYISEAVVNFRRECRALLERDVMLREAAIRLGADALLVDGGVANPFYLCEIGAERRGLDLSVALADAKVVSETGFAPLRPTPRAKIADGRSGQSSATSSPQRPSIPPISATAPRQAVLRADSVPACDQSDSFLEAAAKGDLKKVGALLNGIPNLVFTKDKSGATALHRTAEQGSKDMVQLLLANKAEVDAKDSGGNTPLGYAAAKGHKGTAELLVAKGAQVNAKNNNGGTPLYYAALNGHKATAELLLANGAEVNANDNAGVAPLHWAADRGHKDVAQLLLANKAEVNVKSNKGNAPLHLAALGDHKDVAELLLANKAEVNAKANDGSTPLHYAAAKGHKGTAELLVAKQAEASAKNNAGLAPLHGAADGGHKDVVELLLANKAEVNAKANDGNTPLHYAAAKGHKGTAELLVAKQAEASAKNSAGLAPLHGAADGGHKDVVELLLANKAEVNVESGKGNAPLHLAADKGHKDVVELLLANKAEVNAKANDGNTPLHYAAAKGHKGTAEVLVAKKAEVNAKNNAGVAPLHCAAGGGHKDVAELLLAAKADVNAKTNDAYTPLHLAANEGHKDVVKWLLVNKAEVNAKSNTGLTPLELAAKKGHKDVAAVLAASEAKTEPKRVSLRSSAHPSHTLALEADALQGEERLETINKALALSPQDPDLLYANACLLSGDERKRAFEQLRKVCPGHFDTAMRAKNFRFFKRPLPEVWEDLFDFESWSEHRTTLEGLMLQRLIQEKHVQIVCHCLTPSFAMVYGCDNKSFCDDIKRMRWELRWANTPYGSIAVHYLIWTGPGDESHRNEAFLPHGISNPPSARDGFCLLQRLAESDHCYLVFSDGAGKVHRNELFEFPEPLKATLQDVKNQLDKIGPCDPRELMDKAGKWYMANAEIKSITF
jgi:ankyrin repeat protein